ncbi:MAG TPA: gliding motility-associated ABC transporter ATP-binding subunit GldA [Caldithrix sp.]|nr:gliding motility-associated ABC transporter ATP-binding subunit GldA [Caldithrix sp.]
MSITVNRITKTYGAQTALSEVTFTVNSGEIVGFIGPNGAGKSTMMKIICALLTPDSGSVKVNGCDASSHSLEIKRKLGYLPENNPLYSDMYVEEYLRYVAGIYQPRRKSGSRVREIIGITGLHPEKNKKIAALSRGYRQRVGLAQAIIHEPEVLILDEPTSGLDPNQILEIRNLISHLGKEKTVILSTHIMQEVEAICKRVIIINKGKIIANDLAENIGGYSISPSRTIVVEFKQDPDQKIFTGITGMEQVRNLKPGTWLIQTSGETDIRADLFNLAVKHKLIILSLHQKEKKLEDVFRELTLPDNTSVN